MKTRQIGALVAGGCIVLVSFIPLLTAASKGIPIHRPEITYAWWIAVFGVMVAAGIIVAAFWEE